MSKHTKANGQRKRGKRGMGRLFKKQGTKQFPADSPAAGSYYLTYTVEGARKTQALRDGDGNPITDRKAAEAERKRILAPFTTGDKVETLKAVQAALTQAEVGHVQAIEEANPPLRIKDTWQAYLDAPERPDSGELTLTRYEGHWNRFEAWLPTAHPDAQYLRDVTPTTAAAYAGDLVRANYSPNTFNKHIGFLRLLFRVLGDTARTSGNPFTKIKRKVQRTHSRRELTVPELTAVLDTAPDDLELLLYLGASTGLRLGDCATLQWGDVDLARGIIRRIPNKTAKSGKPVVLGIPPALHERLSKVKARTGYVLPTMAETYNRDAPCITNRIKAHFLSCGIDVHAPGTGQRIKREADGTPKRKDGKVITEDTGKPAVVEVGFHSLRHTWVSMHAAAGTPGAIVQASVGHASPAMTAHYTHVNEATARDVARALPAFSGNGAPPHREPLPSWAHSLVENMNTENWQLVRTKLLNSGVNKKP